jgi:hypothetical protein
LIAGDGEYVHRGQRMPDWIDEGIPRLPRSRSAKSLRNQKQPAG